MKIGLIGLGIMGKPMGRNLMKAGYELWVNNRSAGPVEEMEACGARAATRRELGEACDVVLTMLPNGPQVKEVLFGEDGLAQYMHPGQVFIDMSSISPIVSKEIAGTLEAKGVEMLDAPVSGGEPKAIDGTLSFMVGGKQEVFDRCKPILSAMGASVILCGGVGAGNTTKLANQVIVAANIAAVAEGFTLAKKAGVNPATVFAAIRGGLAGSTVMDAKGPMMLSGNMDPGFKIDLHIKDLSNALDAAHTVGAPLPLTAGVMEMMQYLRANGMGQWDHSALAKYYEALSGVCLCEE
ncbi:MAG: 2-hydroxy-3-oxopropionate reductase [Candidatus Faecousia sp.]|nr:2-hydroxy-3-oxopropionate reductase [Candidatus Faecousia sp.]